MTALRATVYYRLRGLLVTPELLGTSHEITHGAYRVRVSLPSDTAEVKRDDPTIAELDERFPARDTYPLVEGGAHLTTSASMSMVSPVHEVTTVRAECFFGGAVGVDDFAHAESPRASARFDDALDALRGAEQAAREVLRRLLESVRVRGQHWLGPDSGSPRGIGVGQLDDLDAGRRLPVTIGLEADLVITKVEGYQVLDAARLADALERSQQDATEPMEQVLKADALYMLQDADPPDYPRAVLTAAIACEVKIKRTLRERSTGTARELVDLMLDNPRDWSLALIALVDKPLKAVASVSLREADLPLYKRLDSLIRRRNGLAHKAEDPPDEQEAREHAKTAVEVFRWLDALHEGGV
ncbi:MAG: hypothetical protein M3R46_12250 [Actinomycetota bacterium]|nr:hypothetical protein [Actinomycetota bacterium]